ncbi:MAG: GAF domain-containing protein [Candidatus Aminicenantes bacterium]|nr:GAF domain-containing protein [Candidatus Aminicenantes bacterium]
MKIFSLLIEELNEDLKKTPAKDKFNLIIQKIVHFYMKNLGLQEDEVAIFFTNKQKSALSFVYPTYLSDSGIISIDSPDAIVSQIFRTGKSFIDNRFLEKEHLSVFEFVKTPQSETKLIWKMIGVLISFKGEKIGVIEISKRRGSFSDVGRDFTQDDLKFLDQSIAQLGQIFKILYDDIFKQKRENVKKDLALLAEIIRWRRKLNDGDCIKFRNLYLGIVNICKGYVIHKYSMDRIEVKFTSGNCKEFMVVSIDSLWPCSWDKSKMNRAVNVYKRLKKLSKIVRDTD